MASPDSVLSADWLGASRRAAGKVRELLDAAELTVDRRAETGSTGEGGDRTLVLDQGAEDAVFAELDAIHAEGHAFVAVSEERGEILFGFDGPPPPDAVRVIIDPIDGSLNAKRGLPHHALSIAVASGTTMADVEFGFVYDFGPGEEWVARRGEGVLLDGAPLPDRPSEHRSEDGRLEVVAIESADPRHLARSGDLGDVARRIRAIGAIAVSLCQVAGGRVDAMVSLWNSRAVDAAAGQLIVREAGGFVAFPAFDEDLAAPLDLEPHSPVIAALTPEALEQLRTVPAPMASRA
ncbi:MAG TPA: inositol monophosphatase family protein [Capillimicrobium sp.]|jgi:myo-inositol-1(or 4)-monophosphatase